METEIPKNYRIHHNLMRILIYSPEILLVIAGFIFGTYFGILFLFIVALEILIDTRDLSGFKFGKDEYGGINAWSVGFFVVFIQVLLEIFGITSFTEILGEWDLTLRQIYLLKVATITFFVLNLYVLIFSSYVYFRHFKGELFDLKGYLTAKHEVIGRYIYLHRFQTVSLFYLGIVEIVGRIHYWFSIFIFGVLTLFYLLKPTKIDNYLRPNKEYHLFLFFLAAILTVPASTALSTKLTLWWQLTGIGKALSILMLFNSVLMLKKAFNVSILDFFRIGKL